MGEHNSATSASATNLPLFPQLFLMRGYMVCTGVNLAALNLDRVQLGLEPRPKWHHITYTRSRDGRPCYRVRVCKTCAGERRVELGTYLDLESALLVNDAHEILSERYKLLNILTPNDRDYLRLFYVRKLDRGRVLIFPMHLVLQQVGVSMPTLATEPLKLDTKESNQNTRGDVTSLALASKRKREANFPTNESFANMHVQPHVQVYKPMATFEFETRTVLSKVLSTSEAAAVFDKHCNINFFGYPADALLSSLTRWLQDPTRVAFEYDIHPSLVGITCQLLLTGKRGLSPELVPQMAEYVQTLLNKNYCRRTSGMGTRAQQPRRLEDVREAEKRSNCEAMSVMTSLMNLPRGKLLEGNRCHFFLTSAQAVLQDQYLGSYEMCLHLRMPRAVPMTAYRQSELENTLHTCEKRVRLLTRIAAALANIAAKYKEGQPLDQDEHLLRKLQGQLAECVVWYLLLHVTTSLRLHEMEISSESGAALTVLDDCLEFLQGLFDDKRLKMSSYHATHRILALGSRASVCLAKLRVFSASSPTHDYGRTFGNDYEDRPDILDASVEIGELFGRMASVGVNLGFVPVSNFRTMCQLMDCGFPGVSDMKSSFIFEGALIFQSTCLEILYRVRDPSLIPEFVRNSTDLNGAVLIQTLHLVLTRAKRLCEETGFAFLLAESTRCLKIIAEICTTQWAADMLAFLHPEGSHYSGPFSVWADALPQTTYQAPPSPFQCVASYVEQSPVLPIQLATASLAFDLLRVNAERYHYASIVLHGLGAPVDGYVTKHTTLQRLDTGFDTPKSGSDTHEDSDDSAEQLIKKPHISSEFNDYYDPALSFFNSSFDSALLDPVLDFLAPDEAHLLKTEQDRSWDRMPIAPEAHLDFGLLDDDELLQLAFDEISA